MSDGSVDLEFTAKEAKLDLALSKIDARLRGMEQQFGRVGGASKAASKSFVAENEKFVRGLEASAAAAKALIATPLERFTQKEKELSQAVLHGKLTIDEKTRALAIYRRELFSTQESQDGAFGTQMLTKLAAYAAGVITIQKAVQLVKSAWEEENQAAEAALASAKEMTAPNRNLAQLAGSSEEFAQMKATRDQLAVRFNTSREEVTDTMFNVDSAKLTQNQRDVALRAGLLGDASDTALLMGKIKEIYGGKENLEAAINVSLQAAAESPLDFGNFVQNMPNSLAPSKELGLNYAETASILAEFSTQFGSSETAFKRYELLAGKMARDERFKGKGLAGFRQLADMSEEEAQDIYKDDKETYFAWLALKQTMPNIAPRAQRYKQTAAATGTAGDALNKQVGILLSDPEEMAKFKAGQAEKSAVINREKNLAIDEAARQQAVDQEMARLDKEKAPWYERAGAGMFARAAKWLRMDPKDIRRLANVGRGAGKMLGENTFNTDELDDAYLKREAAIASGAGGDSEVLSSVLGQNEQQTQLLQEIRDAVVGGASAPNPPPDHVPPKQ